MPEKHMAKINGGDSGDGADDNRYNEIYFFLPSLKSFSIASAYFLSFLNFVEVNIICPFADFP